MGEQDGFRPKPLDKGKISEFLENAEKEAGAAQDKALRGDDAPKITDKHAQIPGTQQRPATLMELATRLGMLREVVIELNARCVEMADMLNGSPDRVSSDDGKEKVLPVSPLHQIDQRSMDVLKTAEEALDSVQTVHRQLFG